MSDIPWVEISRIVVFAQALFIGLYGILFTLKTPMGRALAAFGIFAACEIILRFSWDGWQFGNIYYFLVVGTSAMPAVVWLFTQYAFDDEFRAKLILWTLVLVYLSLNLVGRLIYANDQSVTVVERVLFFYFPQLTKLGFAVHIIVIALLGMKTDLIEQRRRLRAPVALIAGAIIAVSLSAQLITQDFQVPVSDGFEILLNFVMAYGITLSIFRLGFSVSPIQVEEKPMLLSTPVVDGAEMIEKKLHVLMSENLYYLKPGITIGALAEELSEPEYKVRRVINGILGFRNFNQYINAMRVRDAEIKLRQSDSSVLSIAKELGYISLSSFNKAFREIHQWTPSEYRAQHKQ